eukprot:364980-Chlamydomonas_euryale.AAC.2
MHAVRECRQYGHACSMGMHAARARNDDELVFQKNRATPNDRHTCQRACGCREARAHCTRAVVRTHNTSPSPPPHTHTYTQTLPSAMLLLSACSCHSVETYMSTNCVHVSGSAPIVPAVSREGAHNRFVLVMRAFMPFVRCARPRAFVLLAPLHCERHTNGLQCDAMRGGTRSFATWNAISHFAGSDARFEQHQTSNKGFVP